MTWQDELPPSLREAVATLVEQEVAQRLDELARNCAEIRKEQLEIQRLLDDPWLNPRIGAFERRGRHEFFYNAFRVLSFNKITGHYAEFGCHRAITFSLAYFEAERHRHPAHLWAFDSFQGLPEHRDGKDAHPRWVATRMATSLEEFHKLCAKHKIPRERYSVVPGFYEDSLAQLSQADAPTNIALAYIDCDLYSSARTVLEFLMPRLKHGMLIAFDDYFCWSKDQPPGERVAIIETFSDQERWRLVPYMNFGWHGLAFYVEDRELTGSLEKAMFHDAYAPVHSL